MLCLAWKQYLNYCGVFNLEDVEELIFIMMSLVFLLMGVFLIGSIIMSAYNPYDQITFANVEKLRSAINEACFTGGTVKLSFEMPQNAPSGFVSSMFTIIPSWVMRTGGDPNYVLYYESFPPGEAIGWEVLHNYVENRLIVPLPENKEGLTFEEVKNYAKGVFDEFKLRAPDAVVDAVVINNIILDDTYRSDFVISRETKITTSTTADELFIAGRTEEGDEKRGFFGYGKWEGDTYKFTNYLGLSPLEKTMIKYQPCGAHSLCLKTRNGVYKFPLDMCQDIKKIDLIYDARGSAQDLLKIAVGEVEIIGFIKGLFSKFFPGFLSKTILIGGVTRGLDNFVGGFLSYYVAFKYSDFNIASPCTIHEAYVYEHVCEQYNTGFYSCRKIQLYPLYEYDDNGKLKYVKEGNNVAYHQVCLEKLGQLLDKPQDFESTGKCVSMYLGDTSNFLGVTTSYKKPDGFCWTPDPYKEGINKDYFDLFFIPTMDAFTQAFTRLFGLTPIRESTAYIASKNIFVMSPTKPTAERGENLFEALERRFSWSWP